MSNTKVLTLDTVIEKELVYRIETGQLKEGERLPSERALAETFGVQRGTVRRALKNLHDKGLVVSRRNSGHYVSNRRITFDLDAYSSRKKVIEKSGQTTKVMLLTFEKIYISKYTASKMSVPVDTQAYRIMRLRYANGSPVGLERTHILCDMAPDLTEDDVHNKSIYAMLSKKYGIIVDRSESVVTAAFANGLEAELLNVRRSQPLLRLEGLVYDRRGRLIEYFENIMLKDRIQFVKNEVKEENRTF